MTKEIDYSEEDTPRAYIAMSDRLVLFPHSKTSSAVWDMEDDRCLGVLDGHNSGICWASINNIEKAAVTVGDADRIDVHSIKIWNLETVQCTSNLTTTSYLPPAAMLLKDRLLLGSEDGFIKVWDIGGSTPVALMDLEGHTYNVLSIDALDSSNIALSGSRDESLRLWDLRTGQCVRVMEGHAGWVSSVSMDSACKTAVSGSDDETVKLWDLGSGQCIKTYEHGLAVCDVMMHESGSSFLSCGYCCDVKAWATASGSNQLLLDADLGKVFPDLLHSMHFAASRDLSKVAACHRYAVSIWA